MRKYELDGNDSIKVDGHTLYRVIYTDEFIKAYEKGYRCSINKVGGYIESEKNLSQDGYSVVLNEAEVYGDAVVFGNAKVYELSQVYDHAIIYGDSKVYGFARIHGNAIVNGDTQVYEDVRVYVDRLINSKTSSLKMRKYNLDKNNQIKVDGHILYRVVYTDEFMCIFGEKYDFEFIMNKKGGFIESEDNLSHYGYALVLDDAKVYDKAKVYGNASICDHARVYDNAEVYGNADIYDHAKIYDNAKVYDDAVVSERALVYENAEVYGNAIVTDRAKVRSSARVHGNAKVSNHKKVCEYVYACESDIKGSYHKSFYYPFVD